MERERRADWTGGGRGKREGEGTETAVLGEWRRRERGREEREGERRRATVLGGEEEGGRGGKVEGRGGR